MATVTSMTSAAITAALEAKADLASGVIPDAQAPNITVKQDAWQIDIRYHGAAGNGVTPDDGAFVQALAAVNPTWGGKIYLPSGSYLLNGSTAIQLAQAGVIIEGEGPENTKIVIGAGFTGTDAVVISAPNCQVKNLSIVGANTTTTSNPYVGGIFVFDTRTARIVDVNFWYINGWSIHCVGGSTTGTSPSGTMISRVTSRNSAGGIRFQGNSGSGSVSSFVTDVQIIACGVATGPAANFDAFDIEDAWDVNVENVIAWMSAGTGSALHVKGNCITNTFVGMDLEGSGAGPTILVEDGPNGSPYNTKIICGTAQLGTIGVRVTGGARVLSLVDLNVINNLTHGISVEGTGNPIYVRNAYFTANGNGASGTNYDVNWSGSSVGNLIDCRFESAVTAIGTAGVQKTVNVASNQNVRCWNTMFAGVGQSSSNWFTNIPAGAMDTTSGSFNFLTRINLTLGLITQSLLSSQPPTQTSVVLSTNVLGAAAFDSFRLTADGSINAGIGTSARDTTWGRVGAAEFGSSDSDIATTLAGKGFKVKEGTNAKMGTSTLNSGTGVVINTTAVTASSRIFLTTQAVAGTTPGTPVVVSRVAGTSFTIKSTGSADTSTVAWLIIEPS